MIGLTASATSYRVEPNLDCLLSPTCDGANDYIDLSSDTADAIKTTGSVSLWFKADDAVGNSMIFAMAKDDSNDNKVAINHSAGNNFIRLNYRGNSTNSTLDYAITGSDLIAGGWTHIVATWDQTANKKQIFINGSAGASNTTSMTAWQSSSTANRIFLGRATNAASTYWKGHFSNCSMYNRELTAAEISILYNGGVPSDLREGVVVENMLRWYPLDAEAGGTTDCFRDSVNGTAPGDALEGTVTGVEDTPI